MNSDWIFFLYSCVSIHSELPCKISWKNSQKQKSYGQKTAAEDDFLRFSHGRRHPKKFFFIKSDLSSQFSPPWWILHHKTKKQKSYGQKSLKKGKVPGPLLQKQNVLIIDSLFGHFFQFNLGIKQKMHSVKSLVVATSLKNSLMLDSLRTVSCWTVWTVSCWTV